MEAKEFRQKLKPWVLPIAMVFGALFHSAIDAMQFLVPYLIFTMLFITFCRIRPSELRLTKMIWSLLAVQILGSIVLFAALRPLGLPFAQAAFICDGRTCCDRYAWRFDCAGRRIFHCKQYDSGADGAFSLCVGR